MLEVNSCGGQNGRHSSHFALIVMMKIVSGLYATTASQRLTLPAVYLLEGCVITLHSSCIGPDKEENRLQPLLNHTFGTLSFVLFFPDTIDAVEYMCEEYTAGSCAVMLVSV